MGQTVYIYILVRYKWGKIISRPPRKILKYLRQETMKVETLLGESFHCALTETTIRRQFEEVNGKM